MRLSRILDIKNYLERRGSASIVELCDEFAVSKNTIRRDINELASMGVLTKVYGGVILRNEKEVIPHDNRSSQEVKEKSYIGELASEFLKEGETIYLDSGTTTAYLIKYIRPNMDITIISNSVTVCLEAQKYPHLNLISPGGLYYYKTNSYVGLSTISGLNEFRINSAFMAASGISLEYGAANNSFHEAEIKKTILNKAKKIVLMIDHTKFDKPAAMSYAPLTSISTIITDRKPSSKYTDYLSKNIINGNGQSLIDSKSYAPYDLSDFTSKLSDFSRVSLHG